MTILWPPPYYLLRDRIPFFRSLVYMERHRIPEKYQNLMGWGLVVTTVAGLFTALIMWVTNGNFMPLFGFNWSIPSPVEWSLLVIFSSMQLYVKGIPLFKSYYLSLITATGGGWLYEIMYGMPFWVKSGFAHWNLFKLNANKVLYFEFQVICLPLILYLLRDMKYERSRYMVPAIIVAAAFYLGNIQIAPYIHRISKYAFSWVLRIPAIIVLYMLLNGVQGDQT